ncbi:MAG: glycosyltransferase [Propionibacteriaceae bacterium]|jgi:glycosyltransferase involved in cell wall biosynthesis|nr:glycosyltransferase [Propionibacteriaceae bacterium]
MEQQKYVQINTFFNGSTGTIMRRLHHELTAEGVDSSIFWGRRHRTINDHEQRCASTLGVYIHGGVTRLTDRMGFFSTTDTTRLVRRLDAIDPDVVHLHNIHGYYLNIAVLFDWLAHHRCQVRWTLHDCWPFTGHCAHFTYVGCDQWKSGCGSAGPCPQLDTYPKTLAKGVCPRNFADKKRIFTMVSPDRMTLISPSRWLAGLVEQSFLGAYPIEVRPNVIDTTVFTPTPSDFRSRHDVGQRAMILGVASPWTARKGLDDFIRLADALDPVRFVIVMVGLTPSQLRHVGPAVIGLERVDSAGEMAAIYTAADCFFNPTLEDNFPTVNVEAQACGTPVITYDTGGCRETIVDPASTVVEGFDEALALLRSVRPLR